ncbi:MAG: asparagine synthase (glutamine-hydrolyzing) [Patescibacteria group bacterium]
MCGIAGYWSQGSEKEKILHSMIDSLSHRGPDDKGINIAGDVCLAQSRLSIIDLSPAGHQPMSNEDGSVWIVFNGEIYNFQELRKELKQMHDFKSSTDTEIIIHLYEEIGEKVFEKIQGMFALAIYDIKKEKLVLGRDRMGKKPLFWGVHDGAFIFGSELKALMAHPKFKKQINLESLDKYFLYENIPTPHTIFKDTYKLEAGTYLVWDGKTSQKKQFWKPTFLPKSASFTESLTELDRRLDEAVSTRLVADVPLGIFLSGGLDSSLIAYYASKNSKTKVKTFSIGFEEKSFDESVYARKVAEHLGTEHYEKILSAKDASSLIPKVAEMLDEPMADASIIPTYLLSKFTKEHVTVALGGDGGDELFCGYDTFTAHKLAGYYEIIPHFLRKFIQKIAVSLPTSYANMSLDFKIKKFVGGFDGEKKYRNQRWLGSFDREDRQKLLKNEIWKTLENKNEFDDVDRYHAECDSRDYFDQLGYEYQRLYMMDQILVKVDRASMYNSLEIRAPFLDTRVVDLTNHMPVDFKFKGLEKKYILKKLMEGKLPKDIIYRKKKGFGMPIAEWIRGDLKPLILDVLGEKSLKEMNLFNSDFVSWLVGEHMAGKKDNRKQIWTLLIFALWWRKWVK